MSGSVSMAPRPPAGRRRRADRQESAFARWGLIALALGFLAVFLLGPLLNVFVSAFSKGLGPYFDALLLDDSLAAIRLTLLTASIAVPLNVVFGVAAA